MWMEKRRRGMRKKMILLEEAAARERILIEGDESGIMRPRQDSKQ